MMMVRVSRSLSSGLRKLLCDESRGMSRRLSVGMVAGNSRCSQINGILSSTHSRSFKSVLLIMRIALPAR